MCACARARVWLTPLRGRFQTPCPRGGPRNTSGKEGSSRNTPSVPPGGPARQAQRTGAACSCCRRVLGAGDTRRGRRTPPAPGSQCLRQTSQLHFTVPVSTRTCTRCSVHWVRFGNVNRPVSSPPNHDLACSRQAGRSPPLAPGHAAQAGRPRSPPLAPGHAAGLAPWGRHPDTPLSLLQVLPLLELHANESQCGVF